MSFCGKIATICVFIVFVQLLKFFLRVIYNYVLGPRFRGVLNFKKLGKWAVVTGATDGLGKAYAEALAKQGLNVVLISRTMEKLKKIAEEIEQQYKVETRLIQADFTDTTTIYEQIEKQLVDLDIGVLVNNVGLSYPHPEYFLEMEKIDNRINTDLINCNIFSVTNMCKIVLPGMVQRRRGAIINMSSLASQVPSAMLTVYGATKAYIDKFSEDLQTEYRKQGVHIQSVMPGFVATKMSKIKKSSWMAPSAETYVAHALTTVGVEDRTYGYYPHYIMLLVTHAMQYMCRRFASDYSLSIMKKLKVRAVKKQQKSS